MKKKHKFTRKELEWGVKNLSILVAMKRTQIIELQREIDSLRHPNPPAQERRAGTPAKRAEGAS